MEYINLHYQDTVLRPRSLSPNSRNHNNPKLCVTIDRTQMYEKSIKWFNQEPQCDTQSDPKSAREPNNPDLTPNAHSASQGQPGSPKQYEGTGTDTPGFRQWGLWKGRIEHLTNQEISWTDESMNQWVCQRHEPQQTKDRWTHLHGKSWELIMLIHTWQCTW